MLLFINDAEIRDILCYLSEAASNLNRTHIHISTISCKNTFGVRKVVDK